MTCRDACARSLATFLVVLSTGCKPEKVAGNKQVVHNAVTEARRKTKIRAGCHAAAADIELTRDYINDSNIKLLIQAEDRSRPAGLAAGAVPGRTRCSRSAGFPAADPRRGARRFLFARAQNCACAVTLLVFAAAMASGCDRKPGVSASGVRQAQLIPQKVAAPSPTDHDAELAKCVDDVASHDPQRDADADIAAGKIQLFGSWGNEDTYSYAPGLTACRLPIRPGPEPGPVGFFHKYEELETDNLAARLACKETIGTYKGQYNRRVVTQRPSAIDSLCIEGRGHLNPDYKIREVTMGGRKIRSAW